MHAEAFSGFGSVAVIMVTAMFVFSAAMVRTGAADMIGGRLFRACAHNELLLQIAVLFVAAAFSMFINETTIQQHHRERFTPPTNRPGN